MYYFTLLSSCARNCKQQAECFFKLFTVGNERLYELGPETRSLFGFYFWIDKDIEWTGEENATREYVISFDLFWFHKRWEMYGKTFKEAVKNYITWREHDEITEHEDYDPHLGCQNWPVCDLEGCGGGK